MMLVIMAVIIATTTTMVAIRVIISITTATIVVGVIGTMAIVNMTGGEVLRAAVGGDRRTRITTTTTITIEYKEWRIEQEGSRMRS